MRVLVIGSGGREHALVWKIAQSKLADKVFCAPGNAGIAQEAECVDIKPENIPALLDFVKKEEIDFTVVGPEAPLALGIVDEFKRRDLKIFGPNKSASRLEASKVFAKELMAKYAVPTADFRVFDNPDKAKKYINEKNAPCVVKADGLAQGKGVVVAKNKEEALEAVTAIMEDRVFSDAGNRVIVEDCLEGQEASILVLTDSKDAVALASSQDHKRVFDQDKGPNTGGMGAYSPAPIVTPQIFEEIMQKVIYRTINGLKKEGIEYKGMLYAGIMLTKKGPQVLEFNVRFGDPETQAILPRLKSDLCAAMLAVQEVRLGELIASGGLKWDNRSCVCVVCASGGYPGEYKSGKEIFGLEEAAQIPDIKVFHSGTKKSGNSYLTNGGRVLGVTGLGENLSGAIDKTYRAVEKIRFEGMHFRKDIGRKALKGENLWVNQ